MTKDEFKRDVKELKTDITAIIIGIRMNLIPIMIVTVLIVGGLWIAIKGVPF